METKLNLLLDNFHQLVHTTLTAGHVGDTFALSVIGIIFIIFYRWHTNEDTPINLWDLFIDQKSGKMGGSEFRINVAFLVTSWALIFLTIKGNLTEWYITAYLTAFVADRMFSRKASSIGVLTNDGKVKDTTPVV
jgi:hypothetical protein